jgi:aspartate/methionine/tyrosine aminotransferase
MSRQKFDRVIEIVRQHGIPLFVDEVYRLLEQDPALTLPAVADVYEHGVSLGVMSKTFGLAGLRIGWVATPDRHIFQQMASYKDYLTICNSAPSEFLSTLALRHWQAIRDRNLAITRQNLALLDAYFARVPDRMTWVRPQASSTGFARLHDPRGATAFAKALVEQQGVMLLPSTTYNFGDQHFRLGFGRKNMPEALARLETFMQTY